MPDVIFKKEMSNKDRADVLQGMEEWIKETKMGEMKRGILSATIGFAKKNLVSSALGYFTSQTNTDDFALCETILHHADLSDVLFMQHVINQTKVFQLANESFRNNIQNAAQDARKIMQIPLVFQGRGFVGTLGLFSLIMQTKIGIVLSGLTFLFADEVVNLWVNHTLEDRLAKKKLGGVMPKVGNNLDNLQQGVVHFAKNGYTYAADFFSNRVLPNLVKPEGPQQSIPSQRI